MNPLKMALKFTFFIFILAAGFAKAASPPVTALAFAPDGGTVFVGSQAGIEQRSWPDLTPVSVLPTHLTNVLDLAFSPDGSRLAAAGGEPAVRGTIELWNWPSKDLSRRFSPHRDVIHAVAWRSDSASIVSAGLDQKVGIHEISGGTTSKLLEGHSGGVLAALYLPGRASVLSAGVDQRIRLWDADSGETLRTLTNHTRSIHALARRPTDDLEALPVVASAGDDRTVRLWQPTIGRLLRFVRLQSAPLATAWAADGSVLYVACKDGRLRVIDPDTAEVLDDLPAIDGVAYALAVAPDGSILVGGQAGQLRRITRRRAE